jgi:pyrroline-5-carboxylate reductase
MTLQEVNIGIIGIGNLGTALINGLIDSGVPPGHLYATRRRVEQLEELKSLGVNTGKDNKELVKNADLIILAVKPYNYDSVLAECAEFLDPSKHIIVSVVSGVSTEMLQKAMPPGVTTFRAMPNTAADIKESMTCICYDNASPEQVKLVEAAFGALGETIVIQEELMDSATVLGACGIAYVMRFMRAMVQGGIEIGFDAHTAGKIVQQTLKGAACLLMERKSHPESEIDKVTTPKGCTIAGLNEMEHNGFSSALIKGLKASMNQIQS